MTKWVEAFEGSKIYVCAYEFPAFGPANALAIESSPGAIAILSPPPSPDDETINQLRSMGEVTSIIISNIGHRGGYRDWLKVFPNASLLAPESAHAHLIRLGTKEPLNALEDLDCQAGITIVGASQSKVSGTWVKSELGNRNVVFVDELMINIDSRPNSLLSRLTFWLTGTRPGLGENKVFSKMLTKDASQLKADLKSFIASDDPVLIPAHGSMISDLVEVDAALQILEQ